MERDPRQTPWYPFTAHGELLVENSDVVHTTRLTELSREGCHLHLTNPLPVGTSVLVKVYAWPHFFQVRGMVCYSQGHLGLDVAFREIETHDIRVLEACLLEAKEKQRKREL